MEEAVALDYRPVFDLVIQRSIKYTFISFEVLLIPPERIVGSQRPTILALFNFFFTFGLFCLAYNFQNL